MITYKQNQRGLSWPLDSLYPFISQHLEGPIDFWEACSTTWLCKSFQMPYFRQHGVIVNCHVRIEWILEI
jgi:hypothetical protein